MDPSPAPEPPEHLLRHAGFLRALAAGLVGPDAAEDVVQETWLAALRRRPGDGAMRGWLAHVTRQLASNARRGAGRRGSPALAGRVVDGAGQPLPDWVVWAETEPGDVSGRLQTTDERGAFLLPNLDAAALYRVCVAAPGEVAPLVPRAKSGEVRAGGSPVEVVVAETVTADAGVRGRLLDAAGAAPHRAEVVLWPAGINSGITLEHDVATGAFERRGLLPGPYRITVIDEGRTLLETDVLELEPGATHDVGVLQLPADGRVEVALRGADVELREPPAIVGLDFLARRLLFPADGGYRSPEVPVGRWRLSVLPVRGFVADHDLEVRPGETTRLELDVMPAFPAAVGILRDDPGGPWPRMTVRVRCGAAGSISVQVSRTEPEEVKPGYLLRLVLPAGEHAVTVLAGDGRRAEGTLVVTGEGAAAPPLELHLR